jgi:PKD repeat protein
MILAVLLATSIQVSAEIWEGDFDRDGHVDGSDLAAFAADFGETNDDDVVDGSDLALFVAEFGGTTCPDGDRCGHVPLELRDILDVSSDYPPVDQLYIHTGISATSYGQRVGVLDNDNEYTVLGHVEEAGPVAVEVGICRTYERNTLTITTSTGEYRAYLPLFRPRGYMGLLIGLDGRTYYTDSNHDGTGAALSIEEAMSPDHLAAGFPTCEEGDGCKADCVGGDPDCFCYQQGGELCLYSHECPGEILTHRESHHCCAQRCDAQPVISLSMAFVLLNFEHQRPVTPRDIDLVEEIRQGVPEVVRRATYGKIELDTSAYSTAVVDATFEKYLPYLVYLQRQNVELPGVDMINFYETEWGTCGTTAHATLPNGTSDYFDIVGYSKLCDTHDLEKYDWTPAEAFNLHEFGHQWSFYLCPPELQVDGVDVFVCNPGNPGHAHGHFEHQYDPMGSGRFVELPSGEGWQRLPSGAYHARVSARFNDLSLFQMGILSRSEVAPSYYYYNDNIESKVFRDRVMVQIDDIAPVAGYFSQAGYFRDVDNDGIPDWLENQSENGFKTNFIKADTDGDCVNDLDEINGGTDPLVFDALPTAEFTADVTSAPKPLTVKFTDQSTGTITAWSWNFGDGGTSLDRNPSHTYTNGGDFTVILTVTAPSGEDTEVKEDHIHVSEPASQPVIDKIGPRPSEYPPGQIIRIIGSGFGDGTAPNSAIRINTLSSPSTHRRIKLWTDTKIRIVLPFTNKPCDWFIHGDGAYRKRKVWVTVDGIDSNIKRIRVMKPADCP